jgi:hypothetical protein
LDVISVSHAGKKVASIKQGPWSLEREEVVSIKRGRGSLEGEEVVSISLGLCSHVVEEVVSTEDSAGSDPWAVAEEDQMEGGVCSAWGVQPKEEGLKAELACPVDK